jgi:hypothetical protein
VGRRHRTRTQPARTMDLLYKLAGAVRSVLFTCKARNHDSSTVDPLVRSVLAETVEHDREEWQNDWATVQADLNRVALAFQQSKDREQFLDTRIRKYRKTLTDRSKELAETPHEPDYEQRRLTLDRDDEALRNIQATHKQILVQCEIMRRQIKELERKRDEMVRIDAKLHSFVVLDGASSSTTTTGSSAARVPPPPEQEQGREQQQQTTAAGSTTSSPEAEDHKDPEECLAEPSRDGDSDSDWSAREHNILSADGSTVLGIEEGEDPIDGKTGSIATNEDPSQRTEPQEP